MRALIIDDSKTVRLILSKIMGELGFESVEADNGLVAMEKLNGNDFDVALVDWNMPEMNGFEFLTKVRADKARDKMKIMMVTTETELDQAIKAINAGADEYVMKPFDSEIIQDKLFLLGLHGG